jgi:hypothetical protein
MSSIEQSLPPTSERRNSLEKHLQTRPDMQDLKNRHILLDTNVAPALQSARQELDRQRATDSLKKNLEKRPDKDELVERLFPFLFPFRSAFICHFLFSTFVL